MRRTEVRLEAPWSPGDHQNLEARIVSTNVRESTVTPAGLCLLAGSVAGQSPHVVTEKGGCLDP